MHLVTFMQHFLEPEEVDAVNDHKSRVLVFVVLVAFVVFASNWKN